MAQPPDVDYAALAKQYGATSSTPPPTAPPAAAAPVDYAALAKQFGATSSTPPPAAGRMTFARVNGQDVPVDDDTGVGAFVTHLIKAVNPLAGIVAAAHAITPEAFARYSGVAPEDLQGYGPVNTAKNLGAQQGALFEKAKAAAASGDYLTAARHFLDYLLPIVGPALDQAADATAKGKLAAGTGDAIGLGLNLFGPTALARASLETPPIARDANAVTQEARDFAANQGIPVDAAAATNNRVVRAVQHAADRSVGGLVVADRAAAAQESALQRVGTQLAGRANAPVAGVAGRMQVPETAGELVQGRVRQRIGDFGKTEEQNYERFEKIAEQPSSTRKVLVDGKPVDMQMPVAMAAVKSALRPIYDRLTRTWAKTRRDASPAYQVMGEILNGPDYVPATIAEENLGTLKEMSRGADITNLRDRSEGLSAFGVSTLGAAVRSAVRGVSEDAWEAVKAGRQATAEKYAAGELLKKLGDEPVQTFARSTIKNDAGIKRLRQIRDLAPDALPQIGRAFLEDLLTTATREGGFRNAASLQSAWQNLGPQTKGLLFRDAQLIKDLNNFFLFAKKAAENPNPSGTAHLLITSGQIGYAFTNPMTGVPLIIGSAALSKLLHTPAVAQALARGLKFSAQNNRIGQMIAAAQIAKLVGNAAQPVSEPPQGPPQ